MEKNPRVVSCTRENWKILSMPVGTRECWRVVAVMAGFIKTPLRTSAIGIVLSLLDRNKKVVVTHDCGSGSVKICNDDYIYIVWYYCVINCVTVKCLHSVPVFHAGVLVRRAAPRDKPACAARGTGSPSSWRRSRRTGLPAAMRLLQQMTSLKKTNTKHYLHYSLFLTRR